MPAPSEPPQLVVLPSRFSEHLAVSVGGALGACSRYGVASWIGAPAAPAFPWSTLLINLTGSLLLAGFLALIGTDERWLLPRLALATGLLGAYTTFSTFSLETANLIRAGAWLTASLYVIISLFGGLSLAIAGYRLGRRWRAR